MGQQWAGIDPLRRRIRHLPGSPDLVLKKHRTVIFVHGCFWHRHPGCRRTTTPKTRREYWRTKFAANVARDAAATRALKTLGWRVVVVWECRTRSNTDLTEALKPLLESASLPALVETSAFNGIDVERREQNLRGRKGGRKSEQRRTRSP